MPEKLLTHSLTFRIVWLFPGLWDDPVSDFWIRLFYSNTWINLCFLVLITKRQVCCVTPSHIIIQSWVFLLGHRWTPDANEDGITNSSNIFQTASPARWERRDVEGMLGEAEGRRGSRCCNLSCCTDSSALPLYKLPHQWLKLTLILAGNFSISNAN